MKLVWQLGGLAVLAYGAVCLLLYLRQERVLFFPQLPGRELQATPQAVNLAYEDVRVVTEDGETLHGWFVPAKGARLSLLFCHGNAGNISQRLESIALFNALGLNVLIFDYRGYGQSTGRVSETGLYRDAMAMWHELTGRRGLRPESVVIFGRSLGAAVASQLAGQVRPGAVILESAFVSVPAMAARLYPYLPVRWLARYQFDNGRHVAAIQAPLLVVHSRDDEVIPFSQGQQVFEKAPGPKQFLAIQGDHNGGFLSSGRLYSDGLQAFLGQVFPAYVSVPMPR